MTERDARIVNWLQELGSVISAAQAEDRRRSGASTYRPCKACDVMLRARHGDICGDCLRHAASLAEKGARDGSRMAANAGMDHQLPTKGATDEQ